MRSITILNPWRVATSKRCIITRSRQTCKLCSTLYYGSSIALNKHAERNPQLNADVLDIIQANLLEHNHFARMYRQAYEVLKEASSLTKKDVNIRAHLYYNSRTDRRRYNLLSIDEIAVILPRDGHEPCSMRDIIAYLKGDRELMRINKCHPAYLPLHYVLLFPRGQLGWAPDLLHWDVNYNNPSEDRLTLKDFYSYRLFQCHTEYLSILRGGQLFQEFRVDAWDLTEQNRLNYHRINKSKLRSELYDGLADLAGVGLNSNEVGIRLILPSSFIGGPRHMSENF
ncbi:hypothetical protein GIB67_025812 [Kingdonia uniflora]|uniref:Helitron helicase-like domain-containing protein n=1 Tax=Kingdonia uniflora TaxID=39325 RepID=A0A7J7NSQ1_9MAGN|nr:hypothetical protein GIB67_025812 [Kingdonia uniflora]